MSFNQAKIKRIKDGPPTGKTINDHLFKILTISDLKLVRKLLREKEEIQVPGNGDKSMQISSLTVSLSKNKKTIDNLAEIMTEENNRATAAATLAQRNLNNNGLLNQPQRVGSGFLSPNLNAGNLPLPPPLQPMHSASSANQFNNNNNAASANQNLIANGGISGIGPFTKPKKKTPQPPQTPYPIKIQNNKKETQNNKNEIISRTEFLKKRIDAVHDAVCVSRDENMNFTNGLFKNVMSELSSIMEQMHVMNKELKSIQSDREIARANDVQNGVDIEQNEDVDLPTNEVDYKWEMNGRLVAEAQSLIDKELNAQRQIEKELNHKKQLEEEYQLKMQQLNAEFAEKKQKFLLSAKKPEQKAQENSDDAVIITTPEKIPSGESLQRKLAALPYAAKPASTNNVPVLIKPAAAQRDPRITATRMLDPNVLEHDDGKVVHLFHSVVENKDQADAALVELFTSMKMDTRILQTKVTEDGSTEFKIESQQCPFRKVIVYQLFFINEIAAVSFVNNTKSFVGFTSVKRQKWWNCGLWITDRMILQTSNNVQRGNAQRNNRKNGRNKNNGFNQNNQANTQRNNRSTQRGSNGGGRGGRGRGYNQNNRGNAQRNNRGGRRGGRGRGRGDRGPGIRERLSNALCGGDNSFRSRLNFDQQQ
eukprot:177448_1